MAIAMKDLEIRGAGNLLGGEQSGHIADVGFDLYVRLVGEAVAGVPLRRRAADDLGEVRIELPVDAHLPHTYIPSERLRLEMYRRLAEVRTDDDVDQIRDELDDRYGEPPVEVASLLAGGPVPGPGAAGRHLRGDDRRAQRPVRTGRACPSRASYGCNRLYPRSIVKTQVGTLLVPAAADRRRVSGARPIDGVALLEWARTVIDTVIDPERAQQSTVSSSRVRDRTRRPVPSAVALVLAAAGLVLSGCGGSLGIHPGVRGRGRRRDAVDEQDRRHDARSSARPTSRSRSQSQQAVQRAADGRRSAATSPRACAKRLLGRAARRPVRRRAGAAATSSTSPSTNRRSPRRPPTSATPSSRSAGADAYLQNVQVAIGQQLTGSSGQSPTPTVKAALQRGKVATQDWLNDHDALIDPVFGIAVDGGQFTAAARPDVVPAELPGRRRCRPQRRRARPPPTPRRCRRPRSAADRVTEGQPLLDFLDDMRRLRRECPWKREQTHRSLARYLQEETAETLEAIDTGDADHLREELGDLLLQVYFHAVIAEESGAFTIDDVARGISEKMHRRNPHVFGLDRADDD